MANTDNPYLCGGTFLAQILRARKSSELSAYYNRNKKESLSEQETFRRLISIYHIAEFSSCSSLKTYTSQFKSCTNSLESFALFSDSDVKREFDSDVRSADSSALTMMSDFVQEFIDTEKYIQLVRCLLDMIENDSTIAPNTPLYILENTESVTKAEINNMQVFMIEPFLLGIWHYIIMNRSDSNEKGASTYRQWYPSRDKYIGTVGSGITREIYVQSICNKNSQSSNKTVSPSMYIVRSDTAIPLNSQYYNLIVTGEIEFENIQPITMPIDRVLTEYMDELKSEFLPLSPRVQERVLTFPTIFANENMYYGRANENQVFGLGYIHRIKVRHDAVRIYPQIICCLPQQKLNEACFELDMGGDSSFNELNRTHWSIKKIDLLAELRELGLQTNDQSP